MSFKGQWILKEKQRGEAAEPLCHLPLESVPAAHERNPTKPQLSSAEEMELRMQGGWGTLNLEKDTEKNRVLHISRAFNYIHTSQHRRVRKLPESQKRVTWEEWSQVALQQWKQFLFPIACVEKPHDTVKLWVAYSESCCLVRPNCSASIKFQVWALKQSKSFPVTYVYPRTQLKSI